MTLRECYRVLDLPSGASLDEVKAAYRRLARQYHPDTNPALMARERFIAVSDAYQYLTQQLQARAAAIAVRQQRARDRAVAVASQAASTAGAATATRGAAGWGAHGPQVQVNPQLSPFEQELKEDAYGRLQELLHKRRWPRAIALAEGLVHRIPHDREVRQWQAIVYHRWGRELIERREVEKARVFLKKSLQADPYNRDLWLAVEREFERIERAV